MKDESGEIQLPLPLPPFQRVPQDAATTWKPSNFKELGPTGLPIWDGKNTYGKLDICNEPSYYVKNGTGNPGKIAEVTPSIKAGAVAHKHAEGHAAMILRESGACSGTLYINHPDGVCNFCTKVIENILPEGVTLRVVWPNGSTIYIGNAK